MRKNYNSYKLTSSGKKKVENFLMACDIKKKTGKASNNDILPTMEDILNNITIENVDKEDGLLYNWNGTVQLKLKPTEDFYKEPEQDKWGLRISWDDMPSKLVKIRRAADIAEHDGKPTYLLSKAKDKENRKFLKSCNPIDADWKNILKEREWSVFYKDQNYLKDNFPDTFYILRKILLSFAGEDTCFNMGYDGIEDCKRLIKDGQFWLGKSAKLMKGEVGRCHSNSAQLYYANRNNFDVRICTGYALSDDGMWREHSWVIYHKDRSNQIIETTKKRVCYFGWVLTPEECETAVEEWIW